MREAIAARKAADHWGMSPIGYLDRLPETGVSIARWRRENDSEAYRQKPSRWSRYLLSLVLEPMQAQAWVEGKQIWSGKISANSVRIVHPDDERHWSSVGGFDLLHVMVPRETIAAMIGAEPGTVRFADPLYSRDEMLQQIGHQLLWVMGQQGSFVRQIADGAHHRRVHAQTLRTRSTLHGGPRSEAHADKARHRFDCLAPLRRYLPGGNGGGGRHEQVSLFPSVSSGNGSVAAPVCHDEENRAGEGAASQSVVERSGCRAELRLQGRIALQSDERRNRRALHALRYVDDRPRRYYQRMT
jgi:hypothetical protein